MTLTARLHEIVIAAPDGASALALECRLAHLCPVTISRDNAWVVEIDGVESPDEVESAVQSWLCEIGTDSTLMRVDERLCASRRGSTSRDHGGQRTPTSSADHQVLSLSVSVGLQRRTRASTATQPSGLASTGFRSSSATSGWFSTSRPSRCRTSAIAARSAASRTAPARDEPTRLAARDQLVHVDVRQRCECEPRRPDQLRHHTARTVSDERPEDRDPGSRRPGARLRPSGTAARSPARRSRRRHARRSRRRAGRAARRPIRSCARRPRPS